MTRETVCNLYRNGIWQSCTKIDLKRLRLSSETFLWVFQQLSLWLEKWWNNFEFKKKVLLYFACKSAVLVRIAGTLKKISLDLVAQSKGARVVHFGEYSRDFRNFDKDNPFDADSSIIPARIRITPISVSRASLHLHQQGNGEISLRRTKPFQIVPTSEVTLIKF